MTNPFLYSFNFKSQEIFTNPSAYTNRTAHDELYGSIHIGFDSLAHIFSHNKYYLCHIFKEETGTTIYNYLLLLRIAPVCVKTLICLFCELVLMVSLFERNYGIILNGMVYYLCFLEQNYVYKGVQ